MPSNHCVRCCEEIRELHVPLTHGSFYEARPPTMGGSGEVALRDLVELTILCFSYWEKRGTSLALPVDLGSAASRSSR